MIIAGFGEENSVREDFALILKYFFKRWKKSNHALDFQARILALPVQTSSADQHNRARVYSAQTGGLRSLRVAQFQCLSTKILEPFHEKSELGNDGLPRNSLSAGSVSHAWTVRV